jgi:hypothetical protein
MVVTKAAQREASEKGGRRANIHFRQSARWLPKHNLSYPTTLQTKISSIKDMEEK